MASNAVFHLSIHDLIRSWVEENGTYPFYVVFKADPAHGDLQTEMISLFTNVNRFKWDGEERYILMPIQEEEVARRATHFTDKFPVDCWSVIGSLTDTNRRVP